MRRSTSPIKKADELISTPDPIGKWLNHSSVSKKKTKTVVIDRNQNDIRTS
jgi:hypothetical protein